MSRKHFQAIARVLGQSLWHCGYSRRQATDQMAEMLSQHNALFDSGRFSAYVESSAAEFCELQQVEISPLDISY